MRRAALAVMTGITGRSTTVAWRTDEMHFVAHLEGEIGGRIGLAALATSSGRRLSYRANEPLRHVLHVQAYARCMLELGRGPRHERNEAVYESVRVLQTIAFDLVGPMFTLTGTSSSPFRRRQGNRRYHESA
jgi:hypothetical protein